MAVSVKVTGGDQWKKALAPYVKDKGIHVKVGILEGATYSGETTEAGTPVAAIAAIHEFGGGDVPARSFMRSTVEKKQTSWIKAAVAYLKKNVGNVRGAFTIVGELASKDMQAAIEAGIAPPLSEKTIERKRKRGKQIPDIPLIDTGTLQESINYEVKP